MCQEVKMIIVNKTCIFIIIFEIFILKVQGMIFNFIRENPSEVKATFVSSIKTQNDSTHFASGKGRMMGIDTGNAGTDFEAGMWLMALLGTLAAAVPVAFLSPNLGFKKRSVDENTHLDFVIDDLNNALLKNVTKYPQVNF